MTDMATRSTCYSRTNATQGRNMYRVYSTCSDLTSTSHIDQASFQERNKRVHLRILAFSEFTSKEVWMSFHKLYRMEFTIILLVSNSKIFTDAKDNKMVRIVDGEIYQGGSCSGSFLAIKFRHSSKTCILKLNYPAQMRIPDFKNYYRGKDLRRLKGEATCNVP